MRKTFKDPILRQIALAVYSRQVDGVQTRDIAERYGISTNKALKCLKSITDGEIWDDEFPFGAFDDSMGGVEICDGATFTYGDDGDYMEGRQGNNHYVWFCN